MIIPKTTFIIYCDHDSEDDIKLSSRQVRCQPGDFFQQVLRSPGQPYASAHYCWRV